MTTTVRIPEALFATAHEDLDRPHPFAAERVGFVTVRAGAAESSARLVLAIGYRSIDDADYIFDPTTGARIGADVIRTVMGIALNEQVGLFHIHKHLGRGRPRLSLVDEAELPRLVTSLRAIAPRQPHGILLLSEDSAAGFVWPPGSIRPATARVVVVGFPVRSFFGGCHE